MSRSGIILGKYAPPIAEGARYIGELGQGVGLSAAAVAEVAAEAGWRNVYFPGMGDAANILRLIPLMGMAVGVLQMVNGLSNIAMEYNTLPEENTHAPLSNRQSGTSSSVNADAEEPPVRPSLVVSKSKSEKTKVYLGAVMDLVSGGQLFTFCYKAVNPAAAGLQNMNFLPSIGFAYLGFTISSLINLVKTAVLLHDLNREKEKLASNSGDTTKIDLLITERKQDLALQAVKFMGWSALLCASAVSGGLFPLALIGWTLIGAASAAQLYRGFSTPVSYMTSNIGFFDRFKTDPDKTANLKVAEKSIEPRLSVR
jgi:hypothetical protein